MPYHFFFHSPLLAAGQSSAALIVFLIYTLAVFGVAAVSNRLLKNKSFLSEYFLGSRSLGVWAFALTFAATSASGGSFTGFPSKIYTHGWVLALWIASYMVVPICTMGLLGKRVNQVARISGAITIPDVIRDRFRSPLFGLLSVVLIVFFLIFYLIAQFKAGSLILQTLFDGIGLYESTVNHMRVGIKELPILAGVKADYLLCLLTFGVAVIIYTAYGGFHAVVWTDVMQGIVMVIGVLIMLPLAVYQVGGLAEGTRKLAEVTPPQTVIATIRQTEDENAFHEIALKKWILVDATPEEKRQLFQITKIETKEANRKREQEVTLLEITWAEDINAIIKKLEIENDKGKTTSNLYRNITVTKAVVSEDQFPTGNDRRGAYVSAPGPSSKSINGFLPLSLAISFFFMWPISGAGRPSNMVRLMAFNSSQTLRRSILTVAMYYTAIYFPLVIIFCCARVLLPGMMSEPDRIMPAVAVFLTENIGVGWLAGLLIAAPFAAIMSTVDSFLLMISSALVRDIYQRNINPNASEKTIKRLSYLSTVVVGTVAMLGAFNPPQFLQDIIVYAGSGMAVCFLAPVVFAMYWSRTNVWGAMAGMLAGFFTHLTMYAIGYFEKQTSFEPYRLFGIDPIISGLAVSFLTVYLVTLITPPPPQDLVEKYFGKQPE
ncbi:hypothetical protein MNBD_PLANCTO02-1287 [hydrothermal vent metagenome]|uniref:Sodium/pantothenate symporter n=1 Tax=hydrothermal vent metagenome TaxID=652676 RepID=A0A3B1DKH8_9ZZZZ